jgi:hypothetical protein
MDYNGNMIDPFHLTEENLDEKLFAKSLSKICRFWNQIQFYSVAQHCLVMAEIFKDDPNLAKWALIHEIFEAYLGDIASPLKRCPELKYYRDAEDAFLALAAKYYGLEPPMPKAIKIADKKLLVTEALRFMNTKNYDWRQFLPEGEEPYSLAIIGKPMNMEEAEQAFLQKWYELFT